MRVAARDTQHLFDVDARILQVFTEAYIVTNGTGDPDAGRRLLAWAHEARERLTGLDVSADALAALADLACLASAPPETALA